MPMIFSEEDLQRIGEPHLHGPEAAGLAEAAGEALRGGVSGMAVEAPSAWPRSESSPAAGALGERELHEAPAEAGPILCASTRRIVLISPYPNLLHELIRDLSAACYDVLVFHRVDDLVLHSLQADLYLLDAGAANVLGSDPGFRTFIADPAKRRRTLAIKPQRGQAAYGGKAARQAAGRGSSPPPLRMRCSSESASTCCGSCPRKRRTRACPASRTWSSTRSAWPSSAPAPGST